MAVTRIARITRYSLTSADPARLVRFYVEVLGFEATDLLHAAADPYGVAGRATIHRLRLGAQEIELVGFDSPGAPYPADSTSHDAWFQHLALVTTDIAAARARLAAADGWRSITAGGEPIQLPASSGGVTAFKFRDPDGHPLELLSFPPDRTPPPWTSVSAPGPCIGIDHSAIAVSDSTRSIGFYETLGLAVSAQSLNHGPEQEALDGAPGVTVAVTALAPEAAPPHLELLAYQTPPVRPGVTGPADTACTRSVLVPAEADRAGSMLLDPDGHRLMLVTG